MEGVFHRSDDPLAYLAPPRRQKPFDRAERGQPGRRSIVYSRDKQDMRQGLPSLGVGPPSSGASVGLGRFQEEAVRAVNTLSRTPRRGHGKLYRDPDLVYTFTHILIDIPGMARHPMLFISLCLFLTYTCLASL